MKIERFEDLQCWQKARRLANIIYDLTGHQSFARDFQLRNQIRDAASSVMHNIAEGFDSGRPRIHPVPENRAAVSQRSAI